MVKSVASNRKDPEPLAAPLSDPGGDQAPQPPRRPLLRVRVYFSGHGGVGICSGCGSPPSLSWPALLGKTSPSTAAEAATTTVTHACVLAGVS